MRRAGLALLLLMAACAGRQRVERELAGLDRGMLERRAALKGEARPQDVEWVKARLKALVELDQYARMKFFVPGEQKYTPEETKRFMKQLDARLQSLDRQCTAELKRLLAVHDWITISRFGAEADTNAWLLAQHADLELPFQKEVLERQGRALRNKETSPANYAFLVDRVAANEGRPQRYGTQGECKGAGRWEPNPIETPEIVDARRAAVGLEPLAAYKAGNAQGCY